MKFVLLIYQGSAPLPGSEKWNALSKEEQKAIYTDYAEFNKTPGLVSGLPLGLPTAAKTVKIRNGQIETKSGTYMPEGAGGYCILEANSMEEAIAVASRIPAARLGGAIEVRPAEQYW
ncbi:YciI family protein [Bdellovibrio bacteriovorus]|uniref:YCII-related domain-containing protein n=1 Tax=Bdellovibrio bacteriovorus TaxID=959 RepID=A0A150WWH9_BDEBC|nr:YciI family protein [Bdellovibrio bacteriovorus]KYG70652.1 hypothetical protein AZI85_01570 [Bdellovibrio bacteriovorus]